MSRHRLLEGHRTSDRHNAGSGLFFGVMVKRIEGTPVDYFVRDACGPTLVELPKNKCPICGGPVSRCQKVQPGT
ncbi:MAG: hypothetical protein ABSF77_00190 [Spirochaetia bacterium]